MDPELLLEPLSRSSFRASLNRRDSGKSGKPGGAPGFRVSGEHKLSGAAQLQVVMIPGNVLPSRDEGQNSDSRTAEGPSGCRAMCYRERE